MYTRGGNRFKIDFFNIMSIVLVFLIRIVRCIVTLIVQLSRTEHFPALIVVEFKIMSVYINYQATVNDNLYSMSRCLNLLQSDFRSSRGTAP